MIGRFRRLAERGVLGINRRNADYVLMRNPRRFYPLADDKLHIKRLALRSGIAVPDLYGTVEIERQIRALPDLLERYAEFVVKPAHGSQGDGILVISGRGKGMYRKVNGTLMSRDELGHHVSNVLSGMYSLGGQSDTALVEYRVRFDPVFENLCYQGVPDIRIIVFLGVPVMSMVRLPTRMSEGKANLHQGAIGAGIDMATGVTQRAVWRNELIDEHPDTGNAVAGLRIPNWESLLLIAASCYELTSLGYLGVDIVLDRDRGPMVLEVNARPGLSIQVANQSGLLPLLKSVERHGGNLRGPEDRAAFARGALAEGVRG